jgi:hypothetical protein
MPTATHSVTIGRPVWTTAGPVRPHGRYDFEALGSATRLTFTLDAELGGLRKLLMGSMVQGTMFAEVAALENAKRVLEAQRWIGRTPCRGPTHRPVLNRSGER